MFDRSKWQKIATALMGCLIAGVMLLISSCGDRFSPTSQLNPTQLDRNSSATQRAGSIAEVSPPEAIQQLRQALEGRQPQVAILSPQPDEILQDNTVNVRFQVQDLPIFKNEAFHLGPHINVILDNEKYINIYNLTEPLVLTDLTPGTHTLRVFAAYPWEESFKNEGAYTQTTFHIFAKNQNNNPAPEKPLLTYNTPRGSYGAQPILLDFFLSNAPLHLIAQENQHDDIADWRIRCTVNGESFIIDRWQPLYLQGFKPGKNWVQLEFLDDQGNSLSNVFNNTIEVISYEPTAKDPLSQLISGQLSATQARGIVDPNAVLPVVAPAIDTTSTPEAPMESAPQSEPEIAPPAPVETESNRSVEDATEENDEYLDRRQQQAPDPIPPAPTEIPEVQLPATEIVPPDVPTQKRQRGFFNRFRRTTIQPPVLPTPPEIIEPSSPLEQTDESEIVTPSVPLQEIPEEVPSEE